MVGHSRLPSSTMFRVRNVRRFASVSPMKSIDQRTCGCVGGASEDSAFKRGIRVSAPIALHEPAALRNDERTTGERVSHAVSRGLTEAAGRTRGRPLQLTAPGDELWCSAGTAG